MESCHQLRLLANRSLPRRFQPISYRCFHGSSPKSATPIAHPTAPSPPPQAPSPVSSEAEDRVARKKQQAELLRRGKLLRSDPKRPASTLQKRFWKDVSVQETKGMSILALESRQVSSTNHLVDGLNVLLDKRPVRTASKEILSVPANKHQLATAIALEWDLLVSAQQALKNHYIPLTSLSSRAVDIQTADQQGKTAVRNDIVKMLLRYLSTDTLLCWAPEKNIHEGHEGAIVDQRDGNRESLRDMQIRIAQPIMSYLASKIWPGVGIVPVTDPDSILPKPQPAETVEVIRSWLSGLPAFELAGLERAVLAGKSLLVGTRLLVEWSQEYAHLRDEAQPRFGIEEAAQACSLEVAWQTEMWGEVEDTHDVEKEDIRRQFGSVIVLVSAH